MQFLKSIRDLVFSRATLAFIGLVVLALVIWFVGPLLAVDGLRPLASVGVRISLIVLFLAFAILWLAFGPVSLAGVAALCLLIWHAGPLLSLGAARPLQPEWVRATAIGLIVLICAAWWLFKLWRLLREDPEAITKYFTARSESEKARDEAKEKIKSVTGIVQQAVAQLKSLRGTGGLRRIFEGKRYLYDLPWFMIVGSPSAGKTTALLNSGLQFPLARRMGGPSGSAAFGADGGTVHCNWWLSNEAVLIDTAGRYTTRDSHAGNDATEWHGFLGLLRKHRPRAPINGAFVALNTAELLRLDGSERMRHAGMVRDRLAELRQELGIRFPVYVIVTKADLLGGFSEYFQSLTSEGRAQPWGFTLPYEGLNSKPRTSAAAIAERQEVLRTRLRTEFGLLKSRLDMGLRTRLNEEYDLERRHRLLGLPQEMQALIEPLVQVLDEIFLDSRFDNTQYHNALRGVYFTSGAQAMVPVPADSGTLMQRLWRSLAPAPKPVVVQVEPKAPPAEPKEDLKVGPTGGDVDDKSDGRSEAKSADKQTADAKSDAPASAPATPKPPAKAPLDARLVTDAERGRLGFFLQDVLTKVIIPEAHLVRPNLRWEFRFRLLRLMGHALAVVVFLWLAGALVLSFGNNRKYLETVHRRVEALGTQVRTLFAAFKPAGVPDVLNAARELPGYSGLDVYDPPGSFLYGLYSAPPVLDAASDTYAQLQDHTLLPAILRRMEAVLAQSVRDDDPKLAYETLRVYKLLHDRERYTSGGARDVRDWVLRDWENTGSAADFGGRASMVGHVQALFSGKRPVQSASLPNEALVHRVQEFLNANTSTQRVYERAKAVMAPQAPQEFTLIRAVGPQAGTVFSRVEGLPLEKGVPGLFTYDGYHDLFSKRLPEFVGRALEDDAWVMGRGGAGASKKSAWGDAEDALKSNPLLDDIRRQYLTEYAAHWEEFLDSIRTVGAGDAMSTSLGFDLSVLRQLAAPDSPLSRLAREAARETTLSRPLVTRAQEDRSFFDKATDELNKQTREIGKNLGIRPEERMEKEIVDNRFAALREVVTGQPDIALSSNSGASTAKPGLENISGLINEFYTLLVVADTALASGSLPPGGAEVGARLKLEAGKLPAPFREVLTALADSGGEKVAQGSSDILRKQAQAQLDRIMGLMAMQVSEPCRRGVEGRYPLAAVAEDASIEDFTQVFAAGGAADEFFTKYLAPFVDTSVRPWRYKSPDIANAMVGAEGVASDIAPQPATTGPTLVGELLKLLPQSGPNLDAFYRARQIRNVFFRDAAGKKFGWKLELKVMELEPSITDLIIDVDGQGMRYAHGPVQPFPVAWPGPRGGSTAELTANPRISGPTSTALTNGPWALFRLIDKGRIVNTATPGRVSVEFQFDGRKALIDINTGSQPNPLNSDVLRGFRCPGRFA
ncbi:type VI secretion system membrane subunit TssM [Variovorax ureilyticus]|uniref:Type VI secretion system membrane subunit TssM n=1 Tax=Variovorax ureilyticus TaxID=1836198 RepID=A0ABU8VAX1_9BURK